MAEQRYIHAAHVDKVVKASGAKCSARAILLEACRRADYGKPETTFTKDQVCDVTGFSRRTVMRALRELEAEGSLVPIANAVGGRGNATTYSLRVLGQGAAADKPVPEGRGAALDDPREARFRALSRKHGPVKALELIDQSDT